MDTQTDNQIETQVSGLWIMIAVWASVSFLSLLAPAMLSPNTARFIGVALMSAFVVWHASLFYGVKPAAVYFAIAVIITNITENLSIVYGLPFGAYHHTAAMGIQLIHVPLIVGPIFAVAGYLAWVLSGLLLGHYFGGRQNHGSWSRPLIAAMITTSWDLCVDAIGGTVNRDWVWADGGPWFGVPLMNFVGWMLTMWIIFVVFQWYLRRQPVDGNIPAQSSYWTQIIVFWTLMAAQFPLLAVLVPDSSIADPTGKLWSVSSLLESMALTSVFTMFFVSLLAYTLLRQARNAKS